MKHLDTLLTALSLLAGGSAVAAEGITVLDLSSPANPTELTFGEDGQWTQLYEGSETEIGYVESQLFMISQTGYVGQWGGYWDGLAPCTSTSMSDVMSYTVGCMAGGGIAIDENNDVLADDKGNVTIDTSMPYLVGFYSYDQSCHIVFNDGLAHEALGMYVTNFPTTFYSTAHGDSFARAFVNGDYLTLTVHGVALDGSEKSVDVSLAKCDDGVLQAIRGWKYVDLSSLGEVAMLYFTIEGSDVGAWGLNTPAYFCLDKLMVKTQGSEPSSLAMTSKPGRGIRYDRGAQELVLPQSEFAIIYNAQGQKVMAIEGQRIAVGSLDSGVYMVKTATASLKFIR